MALSSLVLAAAVVLAIALVASPLAVCAAIGAPLCLWWCARGLAQSECRTLIALLSAALLLRIALVAVQFLKGLPLHNDMTAGALTGDESYYLTRALRVRDLMLGYAGTKYDYFVATDAYGQTSYLSLLTWLQVIFGPTPYSMKIVNGLLFVCGGALLFRVARAAFGPLAAFAGLTVLLFLPSLFFSSVTLLKESSYFFVSSVFVTASWQVLSRLRSGSRAGAMVPMAAAILCLLILDGLRRGALILMGGGLLTGAAIWLVARSRTHLIAAAGAAVLAIGATLFVPAMHDRALDAIESAARMHGGHVFTVGHVYKLLDEAFYVSPGAPLSWDLTLSDAEAARFLARAAISFVVTPWPWDMRSTGELALLPEHLLWYLVILTLPFGVVAGWRINPSATALFLGFALPTAAVVALTNGNVGTLFRLRGLVTPYLLWISAVGVCAIGERLASGVHAPDAAVAEGPAL